MGILANENAISSGGYQIPNSLRFQSASSQYLTRTPASAGNRQKWTISFWFKRGSLTSYQALFSAYGNSANVDEQIRLYNTDALNIEYYSTPTMVYQLITTQVFRDPSAWYHVVVAMDTTQATAANRVKVYINGSQVTAFSTASYPAQNTNVLINGAYPTNIGVDRNNGLNAYYDGYQTEVNFIDGSQLDASYFGETNALTGQWVAKKYTGTYGTNGFYLPFSNGTSTTTLGADSSGNGNNWTLTNFTRSAGVSDCWMYDVPSGNGSSVSGTQPNSNYCVINPIDLFVNTSGSVTNSNLRFTSPVSTGVDSATTGTVAASSGSWYFEWVVTQGTSASATNAQLGVLQNHTNTGFGSYSCALNFYTNGTTSSTYKNGVAVQTGLTAVVAGDTIGIAFDATNGTVQFYRNNVALGSQVTGLTAGTYVPYVYAQTEGSPGSTRWILNANFGQRSFQYTPPSGFKALCTANLPTSTIVKGNQYMDATTYTGNGSTQTITNAGGFSPDFVWIKGRSNGNSHQLFDTIRGVGNWLSSNQTAAETNSATSLTAFNSNGFSLGSYGDVNTNTFTFVAWQWDAGSSTVTNTSGSISSQVRANPTAGVSVVTFTSTGSAGAVTVGHGLGVAPAMVITKERGAVGSWGVYHKGLATPASQYLNLQTTSAATTNTSYWGNTNPSSTVVTLGNGTMMALNTTMVMYCFAEIAGYSKFGSYTGNGSTDGPFIYCGFRPKFVMVKNTAIASNWLMYDTQRDLYNVTENTLIANSSGAEGVYADVKLDVLSNGFKIRQTSTNLNGNGNILIYMAFAESPFQNSNSR